MPTMAQGRGNAVVLALALFALFQVVTAKVHNVGDDDEWGFPPGTNAAYYDSWAAKSGIVAGDQLVFIYSPTAHDVQVVSAAEYGGCLMSTGKKYTSGADTITLAKAGDYYFLCSIGGHCDSGMKMKVTVKAAGAATPPTVAPATPPTVAPATPPTVAPATPPTVAPATPPATPPVTPPVTAPAPAPTVVTPAPAPVVVSVPTPAPGTAPTPPLIVPVTPAASPEVETSSAQVTRVCLSFLVASAAVFGVLLF